VPADVLVHLRWHDRKPLRLLSPADLALAVAERLADDGRLRAAIDRTAHQTAHPASVRWRPESLALGYPGLAVLAAELDRRDPDAGWDRPGHRWLSAATGDGDLSSAAPSLFGGWLGVAAAAHLASRDGKRYGALRSRLDEAFAAAVHRLDVAGGRGPHHGAGDDLIDGVTGWIAVLLLRRSSSTVVDELLGILARRLVHLLGADDGRPRLAVPATWLAPDQRVSSPHGYLDLGLAHGLSGMVAALASIRDRGVRVPGLGSAVRHGADLLAAHQEADGHWPRVLPLDRNGRPAGRIAAERPGWCYGTAGVARALWLAGDRDHRLRAERGLRAALTPDSVDRLGSPTVCHGLAGLLLITKTFGPEFQTDTDSLAVRLGEQHRPGTLLGFQDVENTGARVDNPGLLSGAAGVALALLAVDSPTPPPWTGLLLL